MNPTNHSHTGENSDSRSRSINAADVLRRSLNSIKHEMELGTPVDTELVEYIESSLEKLDR